jgi:hypothetical protein
LAHNRRPTTVLLRALLWVVSLSMLYLSMFTVMVGVTAPARLVEPVVESAPIVADQSIDKAAADDILERLEVAGRARLEPSEATRLWGSRDDPGLGRLRLQATDKRHLSVDWARPLGTTWWNVHLTARELSMQDGVVTRLVVEDLVVSGWDLTPWTRGRDLAALANRRVQAVGRELPAVRQLADAVSALEWNGRHLVVQVHGDRLATAFPGRFARR